MLGTRGVGRCSSGLLGSPDASRCVLICLVDPGIQIEEVVVGTGPAAERGKVVVVHWRGCLNRGEERFNTHECQRPARVHLGRREVIPGLEGGIEGMRVGGRRRIVVSPHLAYGEKGLPGWIPPDAVLRFEVELLDVLEPGEIRPEDYPPGKHLLFWHPGEAARNLSRVQVELHEDGAGGAFITHARPGTTWRYAHRETVELKLELGEAAAAFRSALAMPAEFPDAWLPTEAMWADASEVGNSVSRDRQSGVRCLTVTVSEQGKMLRTYSMREDSPALLASAVYQIIMRTLAPHLEKMRHAVEKQPSAGQFKWGD